jgi:plastocyanin
MSELRALVAVPVLLGGLLLAACGPSPNVPVSSARGDSGPNAAPVGAVVTLANVSFAPATVTVSAGQSVEWEWEDGSVPHNVTFTSYQPPRSTLSGTYRSTVVIRVPGFHSATQTSGTYYHTFSIPGTYKYRCTIHADMFGQVVVRP